MDVNLITLIDWAIARVQKHLDQGGPGEAYYKAALDALMLCRGNADAIQGYGEAAFLKLLEKVKILDDGQDEQSAYLALIEQMEADEIVLAVGESASRVAVDTAAREQFRQDVQGLLLALGKIGAGLVLTLIL